jgi:hypothetical protein
MSAEYLHRYDLARQPLSGSGSAAWSSHRPRRIVAGRSMSGRGPPGGGYWVQRPPLALGQRRGVGLPSLFSQPAPRHEPPGGVSSVPPGGLMDSDWYLAKRSMNNEHE